MNSTPTNRRLASGLATISAAILLSACGSLGSICSDACKPEPWTSKEVHAPRILSLTESPQARLALPDLGSLSAGFLVGELRALVSDIGTVISNTSGEVNRLLQQTQQTASQLLAEMDQAYKDRLDQTFDQVNATEKRVFADAKALIEQSRRALLEVEKGAADAAKVALYEANITGYDAVRNLPCQDRSPRLVYADPQRVRVWADSTLPAESVERSGSGRTLAFRLRGNYLAFGSPVVKANGVEARLLGSPNPNELLVAIPDSEVARLQKLTETEPLVLEATIPRCPNALDKAPVVQSVSATILPPLRYLVTARISPRAELPTYFNQPYSFYDTSNDCRIDADRTRTYSVGPTPRPVDWTLSITSSNCGSFAAGPSKSGAYSVVVPAKLKGCGRDCFLGICNCKGRGWLGYTLNVRAKDYLTSALPESTKTSQRVQASYVFTYDHEIPSDRQKLSCDYYVRVAIQDGSNRRVVELAGSNAPTTVEGIRADVDPNTCRVTVEVPESKRLSMVF